MARCEKCIHNAACQLWINHGKILYDDFAYSTDDCPFFSDREWGRYIKLEDLQKFPIREDHCDKEHGNEHFIYGVETVLEYAEYLPTYDVAPKSEVENIISNQRQRLNEYKKQIVTLQEKLEQAKAELAREIFEEIEVEITAALKSNYKAKTERLAKPRVDMADEFVSYCEGKIAALRGIDDFIAELKKKYTEVSTDEV